MNTYEASLRETTARLTDAGSASAALDAALLLGHVTGHDRLGLYLHAGNELSPQEHLQFEELVRRREAGEPVAYILEHKEFWGLPFTVTRGVLIPRPDTETLVATLLALVPDKNLSATFADVGVGSGAIAISLLHEFPFFKGIGVDINPLALDLTRQNAERNWVSDRLELVNGSLTDPLPDGLNLIVSNPPYIRTADIATLDRDVKNYEPHTALDGGHDGLAAYRGLIPGAYAKLISGGLLLLEIGYDQKHDVEVLFEPSKWASVACFKDLAGHDRVIAAVRA
jgi:release factor glutamine methyltransferase